MNTEAIDKQQLKIRDKIQRFLLGTNCIDKFFSDRIEPFILVEELPLAFTIGKYTVYVGNLTIKNSFTFWAGWGRILAALGAEKLNFDLLADGANLYATLMRHRKIHKDLCKVLHKTICKQQGYFRDQLTGKRTLNKWKNISLRYFVNNITVEKLVQMCFMVYMYNFEAEKKNLQIINFHLPKKGQQTMDTYMSYWLENMPGMTGKFQLAHLIELPASLPDDTIISLTEKPGNEKKADKKIPV